MWSFFPYYTVRVCFPRSQIISHHQQLPKGFDTSLLCSMVARLCIHSSWFQCHSYFTYARQMTSPRCTVSFSFNTESRIRALWIYSTVNENMCWLLCAIVDLMISIGLQTVGKSRPSNSPCCDYAHHPFMTIQYCRSRVFSPDCISQIVITHMIAVMEGWSLAWIPMA